ncbi:hypothetical protein C8R45DRAFT_1095558 [Mycena sanguinolenta]|nr:hypothetical protein C8R45DRAFT_1095558 [Mycena sanguinolenta]
MPTTLVHDLGLKETEFTSIILIEVDSLEKIREYKEIIEHLKTPEDYHWFSGKTLTVIDK